MMVSRYAVSFFSLSLMLSLSPLVSLMAAETPPLPAAVSTAAPTAATVTATPVSLPAVVARVNGVAISAADVQRANKVIQSSRQGVALTAETQKELERQAINQLISAEILYQAGQKLELKDLEKQIEAKLVEGKAKFANEKDFVKAINELDMTEADLREYTKKDLVISHFVETKIVSKVTVTEAEARAFYDQNADKFKRGETLRASHILIGVDAKASAEEKAKARAKADKVRKDLAGGADFATLAKEQSTCPSSKQGGGLGYFGKGQMVAPFETAAFNLKPGELSDVVETKFGYHVIKLLEKKGEEAIPFTTARSRIEEYLKNQKNGNAVGEYLSEARKSAKVELFIK